MSETNLIYLSLGLTLFLALVVIWLSIKLIKIERLRKEFFASGLKKDLEEILIDQNRSLTKINQDLKGHEKSLNEIFKINEKNLQKVGFVRFNPFDDSGGNVSFAVSLLNAQNDGVVISSLHGREGTWVYSKAIKAGKSESKLTDEEIKAIKDAK